MLVSLLSSHEVQLLELESEAETCAHAGIRFLWLPVRDHSVPESTEQIHLLVEQVRRELRAGKAVGAHCYAGIGRSCLLMACVLCTEGLTPEAAFERLSRARGVDVPDTWRQLRWVEHFASSLPADGRHG